MSMSSLPQILLISTGGTIAGAADTEVATANYRAGCVLVNDLVSSVPAISQYAHVQMETLAQIDSKDMGFALWDELAQRVSQAQMDDQIHGIVIIHGTDTLEETAFFLQLSVALKKPLVLVGAMRPATALSADGPLNLVHAIRLASDSRATKSGVLVLLNQQFFAAHEITKVHAHSLDAFAAPGQGPIGRLVDREIVWMRVPLSIPLPVFSPLNQRGQSVWPWVEIVTHGVGVDGRTIPPLLQAGVNGFVLAGTGMGTLSETLAFTLQEAIAAGAIVVRASRCLIGPVLHDLGAEDSTLGTIAAGWLTPQKARVLLLLGLRYGLSSTELKQIFATYG